jgi:hypothetical protein
MQKSDITWSASRSMEQNSHASIEQERAIEVHNLVKRYPKATTNAVVGIRGFSRRVVG